MARERANIESRQFESDPQAIHLIGPRYKRDLIVIAFVSIAIYVVAGITDAFESLFYWTQRFERFELDELFTMLIFLPVGLSIYAVRRWIEYRSVSEKLCVTVAALQNAVADKETLVREVNHRTKNNLAIASSLIRLKAQQSGCAAELRDVSSRIDTLVAVHESLQSDDRYHEVDIARHLRTVVVSALSGVGIQTLEYAVESRRVPTKVAVNLGLVVDEICANVVKHGFNTTDPRDFAIYSASRNDAWELVISNSGNRIPDSVDLDQPSTYGLQLVVSLVEQLDGTITIERSPRTRYTICIPLTSIDVA